MQLLYKNKLIIDKINFLNQTESFYVRKIKCMFLNAWLCQKENEKIKVLYLGSNEKKNSGKELSKIEARFAERK